MFFLREQAEWKKKHYQYLVHGLGGYCYSKKQKPRAFFLQRPEAKRMMI